jgi:hypothetical protein
MVGPGERPGRIGAGAERLLEVGDRDRVDLVARRVGRRIVEHKLQRLRRREVLLERARISADVKSYMPTTSEVLVPARKALSVASPASGLAATVTFAVTGTCTSGGQAAGAYGRVGFCWCAASALAAVGCSFACAASRVCVWLAGLLMSLPLDTSRSSGHSGSASSGRL